MPFAGTCSCLQLDFSVNLERYQLGFQLLFWCHWFKHRFTKIDWVKEEKFCFNFSHAVGGIVDFVNVKISAHVCLNHGLCDAQNVCAVYIHETKVGTVLKGSLHHMIWLIIKEFMKQSVQQTGILKCLLLSIRCQVWELAIEGSRLPRWWC